MPALSMPAARRLINVSPTRRHAAGLARPVHASTTFGDRACKARGAPCLSFRQIRSPEATLSTSARHESYPLAMRKMQRRKPKTVDEPRTRVVDYGAPQRKRSQKD